MLCTHSPLQRVHILLFPPILGCPRCSGDHILSTQFLARSLHILPPLLSSITLATQIPDDCKLYGIDLRIDIEVFTVGIFDIGRIGGDIWPFRCGLVLFPIPGGVDRGLECILKNVIGSSCNFQGSFIGSMRHA